ncbi:MAG: hypothetical protein Kow00107_01880 [Planctomycetota bacterium]
MKVVGKTLRIVAVVFLSLLIVIGGYNIYTCFYMADYLERLPLSSETGYVEGICPETLAPEGGIRGGVLMVHGFIGSPQDFGSLGERIAAEGFEVRKMVLPGHCSNPLALGDVTREQLVNSVRSELQQLMKRHEKVFIVAFSLGGAISTIVASEAQIDGLVLLAPYYRVTPQWYYVLPPEAWNRLLHPLIPYVIKWELVKGLNDLSNFGKNFTYEIIPTRFVLTLNEVGSVARSPETLWAVKCPVLAMMGRDDVTAYPKAALKAFSGLGTPEEQKEFVWLPRSNHIVCWDYDREDVAARTVGFLARLAQRNSE